MDNDNKRIFSSTASAPALKDETDKEHGATTAATLSLPPLDFVLCKECQIKRVSADLMAEAARKKSTSNQCPNIADLTPVKRQTINDFRNQSAENPSFEESEASGDDSEYLDELSSFSVTAESINAMASLDVKNDILTPGPSNYIPESALQWLKLRLNESNPITKFQKPHYLYFIIPPNLQTAEEKYKKSIYIGETHNLLFRFSQHVSPLPEDKKKFENKEILQNALALGPVEAICLFKANRCQCMDLENMIIRLETSLNLKVDNDRDGSYTTTPEVFHNIVNDPDHKDYKLLLAGLKEMIMVALKSEKGISSDDPKVKQAKKEYDKQRRANLTPEKKEKKKQAKAKYERERKATCQSNHDS
jgi:hypothetical protein